MLTAGFEPAIKATEQPQTHALDRVATGIGIEYIHQSMYRCVRAALGLSGTETWTTAIGKRPKLTAAKYSVSMSFSSTSAVFCIIA